MDYLDISAPLFKEIPSELTIQLGSAVSVILVLAILLNQGDFIYHVFFPVRGSIQTRKIVPFYIFLNAVPMCIFFLLDKDKKAPADQVSADKMDPRSSWIHVIEFGALFIILASVSAIDVVKLGFRDINVLRIVAGRLFMSAALLFLYHHLDNLAIVYYNDPMSGDIFHTRAKPELSAMRFEIPFSKVLYGCCYFLTVHLIVQGSLPTTMFFLSWGYLALALDFVPLLDTSTTDQSYEKKACTVNSSRCFTLTEKTVAIGLSCIIYLGYDLISGSYVSDYRFPSVPWHELLHKLKQLFRIRLR